MGNKQPTWNRNNRLRETRRKLKVLLREHQQSVLTSRGSSINTSQRQSMLDVSIRSTEDEHSAFVTAAQLGCLEMVKLLMDVGVPVNIPDMGGWTALHAASDSGHDDVVDLLLANGADPNIQTDSGSTPLHAAAARGHQSTLTLLIRHNADVNLKNVNGAAPIFDAVQGGHVQVRTS